MKRLRDGNPESYESSSIHIDVIRDMKEINSLLVALAYPVLSKAGMLRESRLL
jgi:phosphate:Na+ symporter